MIIVKVVSTKVVSSKSANITHIRIRLTSYHAHSPIAEYCATLNIALYPISPISPARAQYRAQYRTRYRANIAHSIEHDIAHNSAYNIAHNTALYIALSIALSTALNIAPNIVNIAYRVCLSYIRY